jgi:hypothetical protein
MSFAAKIFLFLLLSGCSTTHHDPVDKYNEVFLENNENRISKARRRHKVLLQQLQQQKTKAFSQQHPQQHSSKKHKSEHMPSESIESIKKLDEELSIYSPPTNTTVPNKLLRNEIRQVPIYPINNHSTYSSTKISFASIKPSHHSLYGDGPKPAPILSDADIQKCFDYLDIMQRVKKEKYLQTKKLEQLKLQQQQANLTTSPEQKKSLGDAFRQLLGKKQPAANSP